MNSSAFEKIRREAVEASLLYFKEAIKRISPEDDPEGFIRYRRQYVSFLIDLCTVNECDYALGRHFGKEEYESLYERLDREGSKEIEKVQKTRELDDLVESLDICMEVLFPVWTQMREKGAY